MKCLNIGIVKALGIIENAGRDPEGPKKEHSTDEQARRLEEVHGRMLAEKGLRLEGRYIGLKRDLWAVLLDKTRGEAYKKVTGAEDKNGAHVYWRMHCWFTESTITRQAQKRGKIMSPSPIKKEEDLGTAVERWEYEYNELVKKRSGRVTR